MLTGCLLFAIIGIKLKILSNEVCQIFDSLLSLLWKFTLQAPAQAGAYHGSLRHMQLFNGFLKTTHINLAVSKISMIG